MGEPGSLTVVTDAEYETIEAAVMETARGRWFLAEFAQRNRTADTTMLLDAISRLENAVTGERTAQSMDRVRFDLMEMAKAIARTKSEIAAIQPPDQEQSRLMEASESLDAIVRTTERATSDILEAAEHMQEAAWTLRETGADETLCDELDRRATEIYTACSFQDLTAQRTAKVVSALHYLEGRINAMIDIWGGEEPPAPPEHAPGPGQASATDLSQIDIDTVIVDDGLFPMPVRQAPPPAPAEPPGLFIEADDLGFIDAPALPPPSLPEPPRSPEAPARPEAASPLEAPSARPIIVAPPSAPIPPAPPAPPVSRLDAFVEIENLDTREKLRRFT
jgi:chemotaxis regulatin CheY-phosphate phosphatase CheZ